MPSPPKKTDSLDVRLPHALKQAFMSRCRENGRSASEVVREMIEAYVARPAPLPSPEPQPMSKTRFILPGALAAAALTAGVLGATATTARPDLRDLFRTLDQNGDGAITLNEFSSSNRVVAELKAAHGGGAPLREAVDIHVMAPMAPVHGPGARAGAHLAAADQDRDGRVSYDEFVAHHRRASAQAFAGLDLDRNGRVSLQEFSADAPAEQVERLRASFAHLDGDRDGALTVEELDLH
jgi:Ca2+-binding EF-hand superfamily protein